MSSVHALKSIENIVATKENSDLSVSLERTRLHLEKRIDMCDLLIKNNETDSLCKHLITADETCIDYKNFNRNKTLDNEIKPA